MVAKLRQKGEAAPEYGKLIADLRCVDCRVHRLLVYGFIGCLRLRGWVTLDRCRDAHLRGGGTLRAMRCCCADVESFGGVRRFPLCFNRAAALRGQQDELARPDLVRANFPSQQAVYVACSLRCLLRRAASL